MRDLNYLRKLVMETIEEDVRKSSRNRKRLSESSKAKLHKRKLAEGLRKAKLLLEVDDDVPAEVKASEGEEGGGIAVDSLTTDTDINKMDAKGLAAAAFGGAGAEVLLQAMKDVTKGKTPDWATGALKGNGVTDVASMKTAAEQIWPSQDELATRIKDLSTAVNGATGFAKPEMPAFEKNDFDAIADALDATDGGKLAVDFQSKYRDGLEGFADYKKRLETGENPDGTQSRRKAQTLTDADEKETKNESVAISRWGKLAGLSLLTEINNDPRFPFSGAGEVMPGAQNRGSDKKVDYDHSTASGDAKKFLEKGEGTGDKTKVEKNQPAKNGNLKPTQTNIKAAKSLLFAFCDSGLDFGGAYADQEGHILDGHHRWSGQYLRTKGEAEHTNLHIIHRPEGQDVPTFLTMLTSVGQALGRPTKLK